MANFNLVTKILEISEKVKKDQKDMKKICYRKFYNRESNFANIILEINTVKAIGDQNKY